jgi:hypothetical protein
MRVVLDVVATGRTADPGRDIEFFVFRFRLDQRVSRVSFSRNANLSNLVSDSVSVSTVYRDYSLRFTPVESRHTISITQAAIHVGIALHTTRTKRISAPICPQLARKLPSRPPRSPCAPMQQRSLAGVSTRSGQVPRQQPPHEALCNTHRKSEHSAHAHRVIPVVPPSH